MDPPRPEVSDAVAEASAILFAFLLMGAAPLLALTPLLILWINLVSDGGSGTDPRPGTG